MLSKSDNIFCQDCFGHIRKAKTILDARDSSACTAEDYEHIGYQFTALMSEARSSRLNVLASYAQALAHYARFLQHKLPGDVSAAELELLRDSIDAGLRCRQGGETNSCIENNFDHLWPLIAEIRTHLEHVAADSILV